MKPGRKAALKSGFRLLLCRLRGFVWDMLVILIYVLFLLVIGVFTRLVFGRLEEIPAFASPWVLDGLAFLVLVLPVVLYFAVQEASSGASWGRRKVGLRVTSVDGSPLPTWRALLRSALKFMPWQLAHTGVYHLLADPQGMLPTVAFGLVYALLFLYLAAAVFTRDHRTPYDWIAGAVVSIAPDDEL